MAKKFNIDFSKSLKTVLIVYAALFLVGVIIACIFGIKVDINFKGGTVISYTYEGDVEPADAEASVAKVLDASFKITQSSSIADKTSKTLTISLVKSDSVTTETQSAISTQLAEDFPDNNFTIYSATSVNPTIAGSFFAKSIVAVIIASALVVLYVGIRFKKIGGISAALTALLALIIDILVTFFVCVIFRLEIDSNYIAVVLTILGYSLNDTIVVYDRIRENEKLMRDASLGEIVNTSLNSVMTRNIVTSVTTILAVITIIVVAEIYGLQTLRTFAIPMAFGLVSGCFSSIFIASPIWAVWKKKSAAKKAAQ